MNVQDKLISVPIGYEDDAVGWLYDGYLSKRGCKNMLSLFLDEGDRYCMVAMTRDSVEENFIRTNSFGRPLRNISLQVGISHFVATRKKFPAFDIFLVVWTRDDSKFLILNDLTDEELTVLILTWDGN